MKKLTALPSIILTCLLVLVVCSLKPELILNFVVLQTDFAGGLSVRGVLSLITHQFGHAGYAHFFGNMFALAPFGIYLERRIGAKKFWLLYLLCGIGSVLLFMGVPRIFPWGGLIGASGSVSGIIAYALAKYDGPPVLRILSVAALVSMLFTELCLAVFSSAFPLPIAFWGHVGGILTALIFAASENKKC